jgi:hypothetical protein
MPEIMHIGIINCIYILSNRKQSGFEVENEFISKGKMKISYQVGMDGAKHSFTLPRYALILIYYSAAFFYNFHNYNAIYSMLKCTAE